MKNSTKTEIEIRCISASSALRVLSGALVFVKKQEALVLHLDSLFFLCCMLWLMDDLVERRPC